MLIKEEEVIKIQTINENDLSYPNYLYNICDRPKKLHVLGNIENLRERCIAIVGARNCTTYGEIAAKKLAYVLAQKGYVIVSGLARGIDSYAHIGALMAKGKTIAVLGHGLNTIYPSINKELAKKIIYNDGTIITEYDLHSKIQKVNFRKRNRIISGLCSSVIVVEATKKSGSLITANFALEQGRSVYAVPGNIDNPNSEGTNDLIKNGAQILYSFSNCNII